MKRFIIYGALILVLSACANPLRESVLTDCGPYPKNFEKIIKCYLTHSLVDPESMRDFTIIKPPEKTITDTRYEFIPLRKGQEVWECFIVYDSKNSKGKYVGRDLHVVWIRGLRIVAFDYNAIELDFSYKQRQGDPCAR
jgi:hypothetical protein